MNAEIAPLNNSEWWQRFRAEWADREAEREAKAHRRAKKDRIALRRRAVADMLFQGTPQRVMADALHVGTGTIHRDIIWIRGQWRERTTETFEAHVDRQLAILDRTRQVAATIALDPAQKPDVRLAALDKMHASHDRTARLLGLDKPVKIEARVEHVEIEAQRARGRELIEQVAQQRDEVADQRAKHTA